MTETCPVCDNPYANKVSLSRRTGNQINTEAYSSLCQHAERRTSGGPVAGHKSTRAESESYRFIGYFHK